MAKRKTPKPRLRNGPVPYDVRLRIVQAVMRGAKHNDVAVAFGVSPAVVQKFMGLFHAGGVDALRLQVSGAAAAAMARVAATEKAPRPERDEVISLREQHPEWGARIVKGAWWRSRINLAFFEALRQELVGARAA